MIDRLESIIFYFEGSCEICLANTGIESYRAEVGSLFDSLDDFGDDIRLRLYYARALIEYKLNHIDSAMEDWLKSAEIAELTGSRLYLGKACSFLAVCCYIRGEKDRETHYFHIAEEIFREQKNYGELANHYINMLWYKRYDRDKKEIMEYLDRAFDYVQMSGSMKNARVYLHLGYIYKTIFSDYTKCIGYLVKSNELCREFGLTEMESMTFHVLADVYAKIEKPAETIKIYRDILSNDRFRNITPNLRAAILASLAECYLKVRDVRNAEDCLRRLDTVLSGVQTSIWEQYLALMLGLRADLLLQKGSQPALALELIAETERIYEKNRQSFVLFEFPYINAMRKGDVYLALGDYDNALQYYRETERLASDIGKYELKAAYEKLAHLFETTGDYEHSLYHYKKADDVLSEMSRVNQDIEYETIYKEFIRRVKEQEKISLTNLNAALEQQGSVDAMTNLYNRNYLNHYIETVESRQPGRALSVLMIDIDSLKIYNDLYGHMRGDEAIKRIAACSKTGAAPPTAS